MGKGALGTSYSRAAAEEMRPLYSCLDINTLPFLFAFVIDTFLVCFLALGYMCG
jgi:hypothetical protein